MTSIATRRLEGEPRVASPRTEPVPAVRERQDPSDPPTSSPRAVRRALDRVDLSAQALATQTAKDSDAQVDRETKASSTRDPVAADGVAPNADTPLRGASEGELDRSHAASFVAANRTQGRDEDDPVDEKTSDDAVSAKKDDQDESGDVYGLLNDFEEDTNDPLGLEEQESELLFGLEDRPYDALRRAEKEKRDPPPPPVVGVRMDFGAPAYAPLAAADAFAGESEWAQQTRESAQGGRPLGLTGPFTVSAQEEARVAQREAWFAAVTANTQEADTPFASSAALAADESAAQPNPFFATREAEKDATAQSARDSSEPLSFGLSDKTRVQLGTAPSRTSPVHAGSTDNGFAANVGPTNGSDRYRVPAAEPGPFGSLGSVAKVISAYLQQASTSRADAVAGQVLSTLG